MSFKVEAVLIAISIVVSIIILPSIYTIIGITVPACFILRYYGKVIPIKAILVEEILCTVFYLLLRSIFSTIVWMPFLIALVFKIIACAIYIYDSTAYIYSIK